ncbi:TrmH family RNA methyltransferase [Bdellovibrio bacteriovorus]|uniref:RNA methyltransferase n=1 Tax=Bdellovibrio bacteriovorus str. Tiberius TaxID=1069642 RepID=K7YRU6_BDEBC|nr:RNA methyltransferase [Bdellovibrio bacteriovorus]AFY02601.1 RNA methyltransferase [Bdellovibrio bacteriovorus str. Tiberius]
MKKNNSRPSGRNNSQRSQQGGRPQQGRPQGAGRPQGGRPQAHAPRENQIPRDWRVVIGTHAINEVLKVRPKQVKGFWIRQGFENSGDLRDMNDLALKHHIKVELKAEAVLEKFGPSQQGAAIFVDGAPEFDMAGLEGLDKSMVLILDGIEDPHNLGAILRTSWLVGAHGVLIPEDRAVGLTPTVHKVACGGVEHVPVEETTNFANYAEELKKQGYWIYGLSPRGKRSIFELELPDKVVWAIGSEDKGMRVTTERLCDELVFIPQASSSASYNASVATAMALTETLRQHAPRGNRKKS